MKVNTNSVAFQNDFKPTFGDKHPILECIFGILALPFVIGGFIFAMAVLNVFIN